MTGRRREAREQATLAEQVLKNRYFFCRALPKAITTKSGIEPSELGATGGL
jgi:hypothetical protein